MNLAIWRISQMAPRTGAHSAASADASCKEGIQNGDVTAAAAVTFVSGSRKGWSMAAYGILGAKTAAPGLIISKNAL
jgi:hypothetical protein